MRRASMHRLWQLADSAAHFLYQPTGIGSHIYAQRWHHHWHLIPGALLERVCDRYDATFE